MYTDKSSQIIIPVSGIQIPPSPSTTSTTYTNRALAAARAFAFSGSSPGRTPAPDPSTGTCAGLAVCARILDDDSMPVLRKSKRRLA